MKKGFLYFLKEWKVFLYILKVRKVFFLNKTKYFLKILKVFLIMLRGINQIWLISCTLLRGLLWLMQQL